MGLLRTARLQNLLEEILGDRTFESLPIPLSVVTADLMTGDQVVLYQGSLARALRASCSIPGIFEPVIDDGRSLVDGGLVNNVPVDVARRMGARIVIGVHLNADRCHSAPPRNVLEVLSYSFDILMNNGSQPYLSEADVVLAPRLGGFAPWDFRKIDELVARGENAMRAELGRLKEMLSMQSPLPLRTGSRRAFP